MLMFGPRSKGSSSFLATSFLKAGWKCSGCFKIHRLNRELPFHSSPLDRFAQIIADFHPSGGEVLISYGQHDPLQFFFAFGFLPDMDITEMLMPLKSTEPLLLRANRQDRQHWVQRLPFWNPSSFWSGRSPQFDSMKAPRCQNHPIFHPDSTGLGMFTDSNGQQIPSRANSSFAEAVWNVQKFSYELLQM